MRAWIEQHPEAAAAIQQRKLARQRELWPARSAEYRATKVVRAAAYQRAANDQTRDLAQNHRLVWTSDDDRYVLERPDWTARQLALDLGRTLHAVAHWRRKLHHPGVCDGER